MCEVRWGGGVWTRSEGELGWPPAALIKKRIHLLCSIVANRIKWGEARVLLEIGFKEALTLS